MRLTDKGQVTIPVDIRRHLGLGPGDEVDFLIEDGNVVVRPTTEGRRRGRRILDRLRGQGDVPLTTDEIMALTRGE